MAGITRAGEANPDSGEYNSSWDMFKSMWEANLLDKKFINEKCTRMCFQFCYLFPKDYEFCMDEIIQLWIAQGFIPLENETHQKLEITAAVLFETFRRMTVFQYVNGGPKYKLNESVVYFFSDRHEDEYVRVGDENSYISEKTLHSSCRDSIDPLTLDDLYQATNLCTLMIFHEVGSHFDKLPQDLFLKLRLLRVLDFSHTSIMELPSSVRNLKGLRYLNLSGTPVTALPKSLCSLHELQTLKLKGCFKLVDLPKGMRKLSNLRHLDVDVARLLVSMPPGLGDLTELQTLPAFVVGKENGCHLTELEHMVNLHGDFHILRLENVSCSEEAKKADLGRKYYLDKLELQWTELQDGFEILQSLQPHTKLKELQIVGYGDAKFPSWIGDPNFSKLVSITLHDCRKCGLLSPLGKLPFLKSISISEMHEVEIIDHRFCGRDLELESMEYLRKLDLGTPYEDLSADDAFKAFPKLESLTLNGLPKLKTWTGMVEGDFPHLQKLNIFGCSELVALPQLSLLNSLQTLEVRLCPLLKSYPKDGLPNSLHYLVIIDCPLLKEWCLKEEGHQCGKVELIRHIWIDYQHFLGVRSLGFLEKEEREKKKTQLSEIPSTQSSYVGIESAQSSYDIRDLSAHGRSSQHGQALKLVPTPSSKGSLKVEYEAALILQKVYKSFRTRRKLADFAVLVEQQWSKLLDCAELKRSSLSFFDIENTETSVSRWSRARTRTSRVGIGLSKDEKAQKLALQHWLEAIDPRHRYGHNLQYYYATWLRSESQQPFFYWLDIGDGKEINLVDECPRSRLIEQCIKYLDPIERKAYEVTVEDGKFYKQGGEPLDTMDAKWMFVLSTSKTLYVGRKRKGIFQHSSFLAGGATSAAGKLVVENGVLKAVWPHSGHYRPTEQNFQEFITFLKEHNVDLTDVRISPSNEDQERSSKNAGETVLEAEDISARNIKTKQARAKPKAFLRKLKLANREVPQLDREAVDILQGSFYKLTSQESQLAEGYETDSLDGEEDKDYMVSKHKLFGGEREDKEYISLQELIPRRFISEKGMVSYQLGKQLSRNWATGAGPRIGCVRDKPSNFQLRLLNQVSL